MSIQNKNLQKIKLTLKSIGIIILVAIGCMFLSSAIIVTFDRIVGNGNISPSENAKMAQLTISLIVAGLTSIFMTLPARKIIAFILLSLPSTLLVLIQITIALMVFEFDNERSVIYFIQAMSSLGSATPFLPIILAMIWNFLKRSKHK